ncbi:hypothetical protein PGB90_002486 [Kerria lacca]
MFKLKKFVLCEFFTIICLFCGSQSINTVTYVSPIIKKEFILSLEDAWKLDDIANVHYATTSYGLLKEKIPISEKDVCNLIEKVLSQTNSLELLYHVTGISKDLPTCTSSQLLSNVGKKILESTQNENVGIEDLFYITSTLKIISSSVTDTTFINKALKRALKSNETLLNLAYSFHIGNILPKKEIESLYDKINSVLSQVDEINSEYYQFEGGLTLTSLVVEGIYKLSEALNKAPPLTNIQLTKFLNYFLSRMPVSRPRGIFGLLQILSKLTDNDLYAWDIEIENLNFLLFHIYISINAPDNVISNENSMIAIRVTNLFGEPVFKDSSSLTVSLVTIQKKDTRATTVKTFLTPLADKITYTVNSKDFNLTPDFYEFTFIVNVNDKNNKKSIVNNEHILPFKYTYNIKIENFQIGVIDSEQTSSTNLNKLVYPNKLKEKLNVDSQQRLIIKFSLKDENQDKSMKVQQAFIKLIHRINKNEVNFVCQFDSNRNFKLTIDTSNSGKIFNYISGDYEIILIIGDMLISSSIKWSLATIKFKFLLDQPVTQSEEMYYYYYPKPEIKHLFREPERRPPAVVSNIFTGFVLSPLLILLILWMKLKINMNNFPFTLSAFGFHGGLGRQNLVDTHYSVSFVPLVRAISCTLSTGSRIIEGELQMSNEEALLPTT